MNLRPLRRPEEGWLALVLVVAIAVILAWAVDEPAYVNGRGALTDGLTLCAVLGVAFGFAGPKLGWGRWTTHMVGALFAGLLLPVFAGWAVAPGTSVSEAFHIAAEGSVGAYLDIAWRGLQFTDQEVHYVLVLGAIVWGTSQFASYAVFGHRRPLNAVVMVGIVLVANMALTTDQLAYLVAFTAASLFLLIEMHAFDERATWLRRRIGDPSAISALYLRGGTVFIVVALLGSLFLTNRAASSPLAGAWDGVDEQLIEVSQTLGRLFPVGGDLRGGGGVVFGSAARITDRWFNDDGEAFSATVPKDAPELYWRATTYDSFKGGWWEQTDTSRVPVDGGEPLLVGTAENPKPETTVPITVTVRPDQFKQDLLLTPGIPVSTTAGSEVVLTGQDGWFAGVDLPGGPGEYTVEARYTNLKDQQVVTGNLLAAAGTAYPKEIRDLYTQVPTGTLGPDATELLATILAGSTASNPYQLALDVQDYLQSDRFTYNTDVRDLQCDDPSAVECFARTKQGYCLHYASTMAMLLRAATPENRIPTRLVQGFLPGTRSASPGTIPTTTEIVRNRNAHAWVEVYFPGYGWIPFDPTGGGVGQPTVIPAGPSVAPGTPRPSGSDDRGLDPTRRPLGDTGDSAATPPASRGGPGDRTLLIVITILLGLIILAVALAAWLRGPRGEVTPDTAWLSMAKFASRTGFGPRPTQTVYEYATALGDLVPVARADLQTVADAKVESSYARVRLGGARLDAVRAATRRLRISLLRLFLRRPRRRRRRL